MSSPTIELEYDGPVAIVSNNRPEKHNAANDEMDARLWEILAELHARSDLRAVVWRGNGKSFSSGRDVTELGVRKEDLSDLEFIERGHRGTQGFFTLPCPIVVALKGWVIGGSFERALLCDIRIAGQSARMRLPELLHGVVPDSGGTARLFQMAGHGLVADLALTGRVLDAAEALRHGIVSRVVPDEKLDETVLEIAHAIAANPPFAVKMFRRSLALLATATVQRSLEIEALTQSLVFASEDYTELKKARAEGRDPRFRGR
ncbi:MAG: enoyl-CoA hydratase/isomerase family protein [Myxococcota bacterium]